MKITIIQSKNVLFRSCYCRVSSFYIWAKSKKFYVANVNIWLTEAPVSTHIYEKISRVLAVE